MSHWRVDNIVTTLKYLDVDDTDRIFGSEQQIGCRKLMADAYHLNELRRQVAVPIKKSWDVLWDHCECRNSAINNTSIAADLSGTVSLDRATLAERQIESVGTLANVRYKFP